MQALCSYKARQAHGDLEVDHECDGTSEDCHGRVMSITSSPGSFRITSFFRSLLWCFFVPPLMLQRICRVSMMSRRTLTLLLEACCRSLKTRRIFLSYVFFLISGQFHFVVYFLYMVFLRCCGKFHEDFCCHLLRQG